jgi:hypothetical protein
MGGMVPHFAKSLADFKGICCNFTKPGDAQRELGEKLFGQFAKYT